MIGKNFNLLKLFLLTVLISLFVACGTTQTETITVVEKEVVEVIKEVPVEKEVIKEVEVKVVEVQEKEVIKEVQIKERELVETEKVVVQETKSEKDTCPADPGREDTLIYSFGGSTSIKAPEVMNPFSPGHEMRNGLHITLPQLFYYNVLTGEEIPWTGTAWKANFDYTEYTVQIREGVKWNDGQRFTANDVAFTYNMLRDHPKMTGWGKGPDVNLWVKEAIAVDDYTVKIVLNKPNPRFHMSFLWSHVGKAPYIVPAHIWSVQDDVETFSNFDISKGWPIGTGPYKLIESTPQNTIWDRRDDWWASDIGFHADPAMCRLVWVAKQDSATTARLLANNEIDSAVDLRPLAMKTLIEANDQITTYTGRQEPYGYLDWWPTSLWFNHQNPKFDKDIRWAIAFAINQDELIAVGQGGSGQTSDVPYPYYAGLMPYHENIKDILAENSPTDFDLDRSAARMEKAGFAKNDDGMWEKDGEEFGFVLSGHPLMEDIGPIMATQLVKAGFKVEYKNQAGIGNEAAMGNLDAWLLGHGGSTVDPWDTLNLYHSRYSAPAGERAVRHSRWENAEFDAIVDEMGSVHPDNKAKMLELNHQAYEIWYDELVDIPIQQWVHRVPVNTTYWTNWPNLERPLPLAFWPRHSLIGFLQLKKAN